MTRNDPGKSSVYRLDDDRSWPVVEKALREGAELRRPAGLKRYYPYRLEVPAAGSLTETRVLRLLSEGVLQQLGEHVYGLRESQL